MVKDEKSKMTRKKSGIYAKHELVTTHICRRSFATNFYGDIPTALLINNYRTFYRTTVFGIHWQKSK